MQVHYTETKQIVMAGTPDSPDVDYVSEEKQKDLKFFARSGLERPRHQRRSAQRLRSGPEPFDRTNSPGRSTTTRRRRATDSLATVRPKPDLVKHEIKTWWQLSNTIPTIPFDEIISDTISVQGISRVERFSDVCMMPFRFTLTTPARVNSTRQPLLALASTILELLAAHQLRIPISACLIRRGGYTVGDVLTLAGGAVNATIRVTGLQAAGGFIYSWVVLNEGVSGSYLNPVTASGGTGSGAKFNVVPYEAANYVPGTAWVGTDRVIAASVTPEREKHLWKIQTNTVVMR